MISRQTLGATALVSVLFACAADGQTAARYRDFRLGADLASLSALTGVAAASAW